MSLNTLSSPSLRLPEETKAEKKAQQNMKIVYPSLSRVWQRESSGATVNCTVFPN